jgi:hypothetical protein
MKTTIALVLLASFLALTGCASLAQIGGPATVPKLTSPDDCLVIIKTETINPEKIPEGRAYIFNLSGNYPTVYADFKFAAFKISEPGVELKSISSHVGVGFTGDKASDEVGMVLPYDPGRLVIADIVFVQTYKKIDSSHATSSVKFRKITNEEKEKLFTFLSSSEKYSAWLK